MYIIYGKPGCPACEKAKILLFTKGIEFKYLSLDQDYTMEAFMDAAPVGHKTFPLVIGEDFAGGFSDLEKHLA